MATGQKQRFKEGLVQNPGQLSNALAHVISLEGGREQVLGQAWLAAPNRLVTCAHVVERFANAPSLLAVRFPASGNRYAVQRIKLHPSYVRQPDQLVKYDAAMLELILQMPESAARPLPFCYEQEIVTNQTLWAIRYPAHLGQLSPAPQPLTQDGRYLGQLRVHDTFHWLHDLPLAPGDSGAAISDGNSIVALHCGDTATIPGLNLPTTSIRLALWVDALRELGIAETVSASGKSGGSSILPAFFAFILSLCIAGAGAWYYFSEQSKKTWRFENPSLTPVKVSFNHPVDGYAAGDDVVVTITPSSSCYLLCFTVDSADNVCVLYPQFGQESELLQKGEYRIINKFGSKKLVATPGEDRVFLLALRGDLPDAAEEIHKILTAKDWPEHAEEGKALLTKAKTLLERIDELKEKAGKDVLFASFIGPHSK